MSQSEKAHYYGLLKSAGTEFSKHYREYSTEELKAACEKLEEAQPGLFTLTPPPAEEPEPPLTRTLAVPVAAANPDEMPGQNLNRIPEDQPLRIDPETGIAWYQEEVRKSAVPKPRGRRILRYNDTGVKTETVQVGEYTETFEMAGDRVGASGEIKVTLPSYQVGIYKDPRFPFRIHVYNEVRGFDLFEVENFYGGADLVPTECKRMYVQNDLCYDIRTVVRAIETEHRQLQLQGKA